MEICPPPKEEVKIRMVLLLVLVFVILYISCGLAVYYNVCMLDSHVVYEKLKTVMDPELHIDIVSLGLVYDVSVKEREEKIQVHIVMTLTTPGCPLAPLIEDLVKKATSSISGIDKRDVSLEITFEPAWSIEKMSEEARLTLGML